MRIRTAIENFIKARLLHVTNSPLLGYIVSYLPYQPNANAYIQLKQSDSPPPQEPKDVPIPPPKLWLGYGPTSTRYLDTGKYHVEQMLHILAAAGGDMLPGTRILDFGCGTGRMTRWLLPWAATGEIWGTDISAPHILWCQQHLSPPFHFVTTTTLPHLPFPDHTFHFVYAGSVFTHIDDLADAWFLELRRILRPDGFLYITVQDETTIDLFARDEWQSEWLAWYLRGQRVYHTFTRAVFAKFTIGRALRAQVFYDRAYLCAKLARWFTICSVTTEAYGPQTAILLQPHIYA